MCSDPTFRYSDCLNFACQAIYVTLCDGNNEGALTEGVRVSVSCYCGGRRSWRRDIFCKVAGDDLIVATCDLGGKPCPKHGSASDASTECWAKSGFGSFIMIWLGQAWCSRPALSQISSMRGLGEGMKTLCSRYELDTINHFSVSEKHEC